MLADLINRLLGKQGNERGIRTRVDDGSRPAERGNPARALPPPTLCLVVNARHDNRTQILEGLREAGVHAEEVPSIDKLGDFATRPSPAWSFVRSMHNPTLMKPCGRWTAWPTAESYSRSSSGRET
jgi:hypothetical protein